MSKILAVFGATGQQGGSVIDYVLKDPKLSQEYKVRAITRDVNSEKAKYLAEKVEVVQGDISNRASLEIALKGADTIFAMTTPAFGPNALDVEFQSGKTIADVAIEQRARYLIFSTLPAVSSISGGKYTKVTPFDAKAKVEAYIRTLPIKSAFYSPGAFMENFQSQLIFGPKLADDGTWVIARNNSPHARFPLIDAVGDTGKFIGAILADPDKYVGKRFCAAERLYSLEEQCAIISKATGKQVVYKQISTQEFRDNLVGVLGEVWTDIFMEAFEYYEEIGYFGPDSEELIEWAKGEAREKLSTLEEYLEAHPWKLT